MEKRDRIGKKSNFMLAFLVGLTCISYFVSHQVNLEMPGEKEFKEGFEYTKRNENYDIDKANNLLLESANKGYARAQFSLGLNYRHGRGFEKNDKEAFKWFSLAADQGHDQSLYWVGMHLEEGRGVEKNEEKSQNFFKLAYSNSKNEEFRKYLKSLVNE